MSIEKLHPLEKDQIPALLKNHGWEKTNIGQYRSNGQIKDIEGLLLFCRRRNLKDYIDDYSKKSSSNDAQNPRENGASETGSSSPMGIPKPKLTPSGGDVAEDEVVCPPDESRMLLPVLSSFSEYPSMMAARKDRPCLLIGFDSEWENLESGRDMLSWQFALDMVCKEHMLELGVSAADLMVRASTTAIDKIRQEERKNRRRR